MLKKIIKIVDKSQRYLILLVFLGILLSAINILSANFLGFLTDSATDIDSNKILPAIGLVTISYLFELVFEYTYKISRKRFQSHTEGQLLVKSAKSINDTTVPWLEGHKSGDLIGRIQLEIENAAELLSDIFPEIVLQSTRIIMFGLFMVYLNWKLTVIYLIFVLLVVLLQLTLSKPIQKYALYKKEEDGRANALAQDILAQRKTIKAFNAQSVILNWYRNRLQIVFDATMRTELFSSPIRTLGWICGIIPILVLCIIGMIFISKEMISLSAFMSVYFLAESTLVDLLHYSEVFTRYRHSSASLLRIFEIIEAPKEEAEWNKYEMKKLNPNALLAFDHVCFTHDDIASEESNWILSDVSFHVNRGEKIAFVGKSGCGKSTILKLALGLWMPQEGSIALEGESYTNIGIEQVRDKVSFVSQDSFLFPDSIQNNILMGSKDDVSGSQLEEVCNQAQVSSFIHEISEGMNTQVGERGAKLSGGQLQRIAIARALVKKAPILMLDEATSALDVITEENLQYAIDNLPKQSTTIIVAHRLSTIRNVDRIYVMDRGRIVEQGRHDELIETNGLYASLYHLQQNEKEVIR